VSLWHPLRLALTQIRTHNPYVWRILLDNVIPFGIILRVQTGCITLAETSSADSHE